MLILVRQGVKVRRWFAKQLGTIFSDEDYFDMNVFDSMEIPNKQTQGTNESPYQKQIITRIRWVVHRYPISHRVETFNLNVRFYVWRKWLHTSLNAHKRHMYMIPLYIYIYIYIFYSTHMGVHKVERIVRDMQRGWSKQTIKKKKIKGK